MGHVDWHIAYAMTSPQSGFLTCEAIESALWICRENLRNALRCRPCSPYACPGQPSHRSRSHNGNSGIAGGHTVLRKTSQ